MTKASKDSNFKLKTEQKTISIEAVVCQKKDVLGVLPSGFGKSFVFHLRNRMNQSRACSLFFLKTNEKDAYFRVPQSSSLSQSCAKEKSSGVEIAPRGWLKRVSTFL